MHIQDVLKRSMRKVETIRITLEPFLKRTDFGSGTPKTKQKQKKKKMLSYLRQTTHNTNLYSKNILIIYLEQH